MASISTGDNGRRILYIGSGKSRRKIHLGKIDRKTAENIQTHVEYLHSANLSNQSIPPDTARWLAGVEDELHEKLSSAGLCELRKPVERVKLKTFVDRYVESRRDVKAVTKAAWRQGQQSLIVFLGADRDLMTVTEGDADAYIVYLRSLGLASYTQKKRLQFAKTIFRSALRHKIIAENPFTDAKITASMADRKAMIEPGDIAKVLEACPDHNWRCITVLARYGGLRCPSEVLSLRWQDIDWAAGRMLVTVPKLEHLEGKAIREVPLFPEIRAVLTDAREIAPDGAVYVVDERFRRSANGRDGWKNCNLSTTFKKIVRRAGLEPWPKVFHNLRASRATELVRTFPSHVAAAWLGHTEAIADKHYRKVTDDDWAKAVQNPVQHTAETLRNDSQSQLSNTVFPQNASTCESVREPEWAMRDSNPRHSRCKRDALTN